ncbi:MAG: hypothetical protein AAFN59_06380 [Pseudomonadota bacterium]
MTLRLPDYFFRVRENGAQVFRVDTENRMKRIEMDPIAVLNIKNGDIKPQGQRTLSQEDMAEITKWMDARRALLAHRELDDILRTIDHLNLTASWAQSKASEDALDTVTDALLMAMHDLRTVLVRKKADRIEKSGPSET